MACKAIEYGLAHREELTNFYSAFQNLVHCIKIIWFTHDQRPKWIIWKPQWFALHFAQSHGYSDHDLLKEMKLLGVSQQINL